MSLKCGIGKQNKSKHADKLPPQNELVPIKNTLVVPRVEGGGVWEVGEGSQKVQTSSYKINK